MFASIVKSKVIRSNQRHSVFSETTRTASLILPRLYLTGYAVASDEEHLQTLGVTHVLSVMEFPPEYTNGGMKTLQVNIADEPGRDILRHLDDTTKFIRDALEENETNVVMVHCLMGMSRSATVVCAYLLATTSMSLSEVLAFVKEKRPVIRPNLGFYKQLETYSLRFLLPPPPTPKVTSSIQERIRRLKGRAGTASDSVELVVQTVAEP